MGKVETKGTCRYCGKVLSKAGLINHEKACKENPANQVTDEVVETVQEVQEEDTTPAVEPAKADLVTIKVNTELNCYIGDRYYRFKAGEVCEVPQAVKERLMGAGLLEAI